MELKDCQMGQDQAYAKVGFYGQQGSGKTFTSSLFAIGLHKYIKSKKPVFFQDTETGSSFVKHLFDAEGIQLIGRRSKSFAELLESSKFAEKNCDIMIVDSVTHIWTDLCEAFRKKKYVCDKCGGTGKFQNNNDCIKCNGSGTYKDRIAIWDYAVIKREWNIWVDFFINSKLHFFVCGRAGGKYELRENVEGKDEVVKVDDKFKAESEYGYEMSLLIPMHIQKTNKGIDNIALIEKDRFNKINGFEFVKPQFENILPHIEMLNIGGAHIGTLEGKSTLEILKTPKGSAEEYGKQKTIVLEKIQALLMLNYPASSADDKRAKLETVKTVFGTYSWTEIEEMKLEQLEQGYEKLYALFNTPKVEKDNGQKNLPVTIEKPKKGVK